MRKFLYLLFIQFLVLQTSVSGQIFFTVELQDDNVTYLVKLRPEASYSAPLNTTNNSQVTFAVPTGGFEVDNVKNFTGAWANQPTVVAPEENAGNDYLFFNLSGNITTLDYVSGEEVELFSFENVGQCTGKLDFISSDDPFIFNSQKLNAGNQITVLGAGLINAFSGTYGADANCQESQVALDDCITVDSIITTNPTQCGAVGGTITIHAKADNGFPLQYSIDDGNNFQSDSLFTDLVSGKTYVIIIRDIIPLCIIDNGIIELGPPADALIISTGSTPDNCMMTDGTISIEAVPVAANTILEYSIDDGQTWLENDGNFSGLAAGTYNPRVRAKDAPCHDEVEEIVVAAACDDGGGDGGGDDGGTGTGNEDSDCIYSFVLDLEDGKFVVSVLADTTIAVPFNTTPTAQILLKVPTGNFQVSNFVNLTDGVQFAENSRSNSPTEAPEFDYITFGLTTLGTRSILYTKGEKIPLFSFENGGDCTGEQVLFMENFTDPFFTDGTTQNSDNVNANQQLTVAATGSDLSIICVESNGISDCGEFLMTDTTGSTTPNYPTDSIFLTIPVDEASTICLDDELDIDNADLGTVSLCNQGSTIMITLTDGSHCIDLLTDDHFNQKEIICIVHFDANDNTISDTTFLVLCPKISLGEDLSICKGETVSLTPFGGTGNFNWITEGNISCTDCPNPEITPDVPTQYILMSMDEDGCMDLDTIQVNLLDTPTIAEVEATQPSNCLENGAISISANGGQGVLQYSIDNGATFQNDPLFENLGTGDHQVIVANEDASCSTPWPQTVALTIAGAPDIVGLDVTAPNDCKDEKGSILIRATGPDGDLLEYTIDNGTTWQAENLFSDLEAGDYNVLVRIQNSDCQSAFVNNPVQIIEQTPLQIETTPGDRTICSDENSTIQLVVSENIAEYTITGGTFENDVMDANTLTFKAIPSSEGSTYTVSITGESGCTISEEFTLMVGENTDMWDIQIETTPASCEDNDGSINVVVNGDNNGFTFCWEPNKASGPDYMELSSDSTYNLTITGASGCEVIRENLTTGTTCAVPSCDIFKGLDTLNAFVVGEIATVCLPISGMDLSEFQFYVNNQLVDLQLGECMQTSFFYGYEVLLNLGTAPYVLKNWTVNDDTLTNFEFQNIEELVTAMNQFDFQANWVLNEDLKVIQGFSTANNYGSLNVQPDGSANIAELQLNTMNTMFQSIILDSERGTKKYTIKDPLNDCEDELFIKVQGLDDGIDTLNLVTFINTPINDQCLDTSETGTDNLEIKVCNAPATGILNLTDGDPCFGYTPNEGFLGKDFFCLELCNGTICDTTMVTVTVNEEGLVFFTGFSPNGDQVNDAFTIKNIESYPENNLTIYNRWGNSIFKKTNYTNEEGWMGMFEGRDTPDGVYFYLLKVVINDEEEVFSGPVTIAR